LFIAQPRSKSDILERARHIRKVFELDSAIYVPVDEIIERIDSTIDETFQWEICDDCYIPADVEAFYDPQQNFMCISNKTYVDATNGNGRARFTLAHELGHYILGVDKVILPRSSIKNLKILAFQNPEWQANTFASLFLALPDIIRNFHNAFEVSEKCGLSYQASDIAFKNAKKANM
jgi:Zn-dependent peptidase ImmA (M78 family)